MEDLTKLYEAYTEILLNRIFTGILDKDPKAVEEAKCFKEVYKLLLYYLAHLSHLKDIIVLNFERSNNDKQLVYLRVVSQAEPKKAFTYFVPVPVSPEDLDIVTPKLLRFVANSKLCLKNGKGG